MKPETAFRRSRVDPFLRNLSRCYVDAISQRGKAGTPDYYVCIAGVFIALECKVKGGKLAPLQKVRLSGVQSCGGVALVATPDNWEKVKQVLTEISKGNVNGIQDKIRALQESTSFDRLAEAVIFPVTRRSPI